MKQHLLTGFKVMLGLGVLLTAFHVKYDWNVRYLTDWSEIRGIEVTKVNEADNYDERGPWSYDSPNGEVYRIEGKRNGKPVTLWAQKLWDWSICQENGPDSYQEEK